MASLSGVWNVQEFTDTGDLMALGRLYTYVAGTTTHKIAYTDAAGAIPHTYTSDGMGGQYLALNARGELPAPLFLTADAYDLALKTPAGASVWTRRAQIPTSADVSFIQEGASAVTRTAQNKMREIRSVMDTGATGAVAFNATAAFQGGIDDAISDATPGNSLYVTDGDHRVSTVTIDMDDVVSSTTGRVSVYGNGQGSAVTMRDNPNNDIFRVVGGTGSFGFSLHDLRFQVGTQGNNRDASVVNTTNDATMLDFQIYDNYINGVPRGFSGQYVSGIFQGNLFDFMTDYAIHGTSKEFRKLEFTGNHFFAIKQRAFYVEGELRSDGTPTLAGDRTNGRGGGHLTITGNGFDRIFDDTETCQFIYFTAMDNFAIAGNWFNGKTPDSTAYPLDAIRLVDCHNFVIAANAAWKFDRGIYLQDCTRFKIDGLHIDEGNQDAGTATGAVTMVDCSDFEANVSVSRSGGTGVILDGCSGFTLEGRITEAQYTGLIINDCLRGSVNVEVVDANMADSATATNQKGIDARGTTTGVIFNGSSSYVTNAAAGQLVNFMFGATSDSNELSSANASGKRTGGTAVSDTGTNNYISNVRGWRTKNSGSTTITNPATSVTVSHGMDQLPAADEIVVTPTSNFVVSQSFWVHTVTATQFTISVNTTPTATLTFNWSIDTEVR